MSVIQKIQEKYAKLMAIIIAVALIIFVVMLAFENGGSLFQGSNSTSVGKVNGKSIEYNDFLKKIEQQENYMQQQGYGASGPMLQQQANEAAWNQEINQVLQNAEFDRLGIKAGKKEVGDILYGANPPEDLKRQFTDSLGVYNAQMAKQQIDQVLKKKSGTPEELAAREQLIAYIAYLENSRLTEKYNSLLANSANVPKWLIEKENTDKSQIAKLTVVRESYAAAIDSTIKITDKEVEEYVSKNKDDFKQQESRSIAYVAFSALPSAGDSAATRERLLSLKAEMDSTKDIKRFLALQGVQNYYDSYINGGMVQIAAKDSIFKSPVGTVYGPYLDGGSYSLAKLIGVRSQADTVKVRHILVATSRQDPQTGQSYPVRDTAEAKKLIDSIQLAINSGSKFDSLVKLSDDDPEGENPQRGKYKGGIYDKVTAGQMVSSFNDFIFGNPVGAKGVVKTEFGYHYIEILSAKGGSAAYKVAYVSKPIEVSSETDNRAEEEANQFATASRDAKSFDANAEKLKLKGINKNVATDIAPMAYQIPGVGASRTFIKNIYKADRGDVLDPERVGDNYVVAIVTEVNKEGTMPVGKARFSAESILKNKKAAEKLKQKLGTPATLEQAAAALGNKPIETIDSLRMTGQQTANSAMSLSSEPKVIGAAFNAANKGKVVVVEGANGIYAVRVDEISATALADANVAEQRKQRYQQAKQQATYRSPIQAMRNAATIKDRRSEFF
ncbi:MAG: SurA N-terminal domain-containing protein [Chitinophagaceae bacterium]|nr:SurA N-terminal domain-containing protein [Chitinophagaceae bacterium]